MKRLFVLFFLLAAVFSLPSASNIAPLTPLKPGTSAAFLEITIGDSTKLSELPIQYRGSLADLESIQLWKEGSQQGFDDGDNLISSQPAAASVVFLDVAGPGKFYVVGALASAAIDGNTIQFQLPAGGLGEKSPAAFSGAVVIDALPPQLSASQPAVVGDSLYYTLEVMDSNIDKNAVKFFLKSDAEYSELPVFSIASGFQAVVAAGQFADGTQLDSYWTAADTAGNSAVSPIMNFVVDRTPPLIQLESLPRKFSSSHVEIRGAIIEAAKQKNQPAISSPFSLISYDPATGSFVFSAELAEGDYGPKVTFLDDSGNEGSATISFSVDQTPPEVSILSPLSGSLTGVSPEVAVSTSENSECSYSTGDSFEAFSITGAQLHTVLLPNFTKGYVEVSCTDEAGNTAQLSSVNWVVSNTGPQINQLVFSKNPVANETEMKIVASASGLNGPIRAFRYSIDGHPPTEVPSESSTTKQEFVVSISAAQFSDGSHAVVAEAKDDVAWGNPMAASLRVDRTPPAITDLAKANGALKFSVREPNIYFVQTMQDGKPGVVSCSEQDGSYSCSAPIEQGTVVIEAMDVAGNKARLEVDTGTLREPMFSGQFLSFWIQRSNFPMLFGTIGLLFAAWLLGTKTELNKK